jgi:hypothetical protein
MEIIEYLQNTENININEVDTIIVFKLELAPSEIFLPQIQKNVYHYEFMIIYLNEIIDFYLKISHFFNLDFSL